jgi:RNA polymerase sigma-70 factor, ECF subfamily
MPRFLLWKTRAMATATLAWEQFGGTTSSGEAASRVNVSGGRILIDSLDQPLVSRCLNGDQAAWEDLVRQHTRNVYGLCFRFTNSAQEAQDLTQDVFLRVFKTIKTFRSTEGSFHTWLARVTRNLLIDHYRRTRQERVTDSIEQQLPMLEEAGGAAAARPDQALAGREASEILQATLQKLSPDLREAVILRDLQEMEYREIAGVLDIPEGTVKSRINRGRAELARLLRKQKLVV